MKIIVFDNAKEVKDITENVRNPKPYGLDEIQWEGGGATFNHNYVIVEDDQTLEDLTDEDILNQKKEQARMDIARFYDNRRIEALAHGKEKAAEAAFHAGRAKINAGADNEAVIVAAQNYKNDPEAAT
jgi:flagellar biosynthesis/type III secretory pathway protein FliH